MHKFRLLAAVVFALGASGVLMPMSSASLALAAPGSSCGFASQQVDNLQSDPILGVSQGGGPGKGGPGGNVLGQNYIATTPSSLIPSGATGITDTNAITGSASSPASTMVFAAGYDDESELYELLNNSTSGQSPGGSPGAYDASSQAPSALNSLPNGSVTDPTESPAVSSSGAGLPYAAVLDPSTSKVLGSVPVTVNFKNYTFNPTAWMPNGNQPSPTCQPDNVQGGKGVDKLFAVVSFDVSSLYTSGALQSGQTYEAYLLLRGTDVSGPLGDHIWFFNNQVTPPPPPPPPPPVAPPIMVYTGYADSPLPCGCDSFPRYNYMVEWFGHTDPNTFFVGSPGPGNSWDSGGVTIVNTSSSTITLNAVDVKVGDQIFDPWGSGSLGPGQAVILAQTSSSDPEGSNFDTSEVNPSCSTPNANVPAIIVQTGGTQYKFLDNARVLDTLGTDVGACLGLNETHDWTRTDFAGSGTFIDP